MTRHSTSLAMRVTVSIQALDCATRKVAEQKLFGPMMIIVGNKGKDNMTPSQRKVLELSASGMLNQDIADQLGISRRTVEAHLSAAREDLGAKTTTQAVAEAIRKGIILSLTVVCLTNALTTNYSVDMRPIRIVRTARSGRKEV